MPTLLSGAEVCRALCLRDLTDAAGGPHAMQLIVTDVVRALAEAWRCPVLIWRQPPLVAVEDHYDRLNVPREAAARDARYSRYVTDGVMLRAHTTAAIPSVMRALTHAPYDDVLVACPGLVWRRDTIDRLHVGAPHQLDLWRVARRPLDLEEMIAIVVGAALPGRAWTTHAAQHPYTLGGRQIDVDGVEIGECGLALPSLLPPERSGLAMGLGLDRLLMRRKGIDDIRLLRDGDPRVARQMLDLSPYRAVSSQPPIRRDLSLAVGESVTAEELGDRVREALGADAEMVECVELLAETACGNLPQVAVERMGIGPGQKNALVRVVLRHPSRALTHAEANRLRDRIYAALHEGARHEWT